MHRTFYVLQRHDSTILRKNIYLRTLNQGNPNRGVLHNLPRPP